MKWNELCEAFEAGELGKVEFVELALETGKSIDAIGDGIELEGLDGDAAPLDPRDPDPSRPGIFRDHNCARCHDGQKPCVRGNPHNCDWPHARND